MVVDWGGVERVKKRETLKILFTHPSTLSLLSPSNTIPLSASLCLPLRSPAQVDPSLVARSRDMLIKGFKKLASFEVKGGGEREIYIYMFSIQYEYSNHIHPTFRTHDSWVLWQPDTHPASP